MYNSILGVKPNSQSGFSTAAAHRFIQMTKNKMFDAHVMGIDRVPETLERVVILDLIIRGLEGDISIREVSQFEIIFILFFYSIKKI